MTDLDSITPFSLIREISIAGRENPAVYLLACKPGTVGAVEDDLLAEIRVQLDDLVVMQTISALLERSFTSQTTAPLLRLVEVDQCAPGVMESLDGYSALLAENGSQLLLLAESDTADQLLRAAPNLRNRLDRKSVV